MSQEQKNTIGGYGQTTILWFGISIIIFAFFLLANLQNILQFNTAVAFLMIWTASLIYLGMVNRNPNLKGHVKSVDAFWQVDINKQGLKWIGIGLGGVFLAVAVSVFINSALIGIILSGFVLMFAFIKTNSILVPVIIHGVYNSVVVAIKQGALQFSGFFGDFTQSLLDSSPIRVPEVGVGIQGLSKLYSEIIWQFILVATAEELMKIAVLIFVVIAIKSRFERGNPVYIGAIISVIIWGLLHSIQSLSI